MTFICGKVKCGPPILRIFGIDISNVQLLFWDVQKIEHFLDITTLSRNQEVLIILLFLFPEICPRFCLTFWLRLWRSLLIWTVQMWFVVFILLESGWIHWQIGDILTRIRLMRLICQVCCCSYSDSSAWSARFSVKFNQIAFFPHVINLIRIVVNDQICPLFVIDGPHIMQIYPMFFILLHYQK